MYFDGNSQINKKAVSGRGDPVLTADFMIMFIGFYVLPKNNGELEFAYLFLYTIISGSEPLHPYSHTSIYLSSATSP